MGRRGPRPKPTALRVLEGNPSKRPLPPREPKPPKVSAPPAPRHLDAIARAEWRRQARELELVGVLTTVDRTGLEVYCVTYARWRYQVAELARARRSKTEHDKAWRLEAAIDRTAGLLRQYMAEFGLTPAARVRLETDEPPAPPQRNPAATGTDGKPRRDPSRFFRDPEPD